METEKVLEILKIYKGKSDSKFQYYNVIVTDKDAELSVLTIGCKVLHTNTVEKTFRRLIFVPVPRPEIDMTKIEHVEIIDPALKPQEGANYEFDFDKD